MQDQKIKSHYQIAIIGGGPAGSACAIHLGNLGVKDIIILESGEYDKFRIGESIPPETRSVFQQLGILEAFLAEKHDACYGSVSFWGNDLRGYNDSILSPFGHGWHLDRRRFNQFLAREAVHSGATLVTNAGFKNSTKLESEEFELNFITAEKTANKITTSTVVDATGSKALFALQQGSKKINADPLLCLAMRFTAANPKHNLSKLTHLEAVEYGWWYAAQLPDKSLLVTLYSDNETVKKHSLNLRRQWLRYLESTPNTSKLIKEMKPFDKKPKGFPALSYRLNRITGQNWLAIGDAASAYDPITSQGIIKSLSNAILAAETIANYIKDAEKSLDTVENEIINKYNQYLDIRKYFYQLEGRWPESAFWQKFQRKSEPVY